MQCKRFGFTLIELLIVIALIGLLASVILSSLNQARVKANDARREMDMRTIRTALELYALDHNGNYPQVGSYGEMSPGSWDYSSQDIDGDGIYFLDPLVELGYLSKEVVDPRNDGVGDVCCTGGAFPGSGYAYGYFNYAQWSPSHPRYEYFWLGYRPESGGPGASFRWRQYKR